MLACCACAGAPHSKARHAAKGALIRTTVILLPPDIDAGPCPPSRGQNTSRIALFRRSRALDVGQSGFAGVLLIRHRLEPGYMLAGLGLLHGYMFHSVLGSRTVPVFFARWNPDGIAGANFLY